MTNPAEGNRKPDFADAATNQWRLKQAHQAVEEFLAHFYGGGTHEKAGRAFFALGLIASSLLMSDEAVQQRIDEDACDV